MTNITGMMADLSHTCKEEDMQDNKEIEKESDKDKFNLDKEDKAKNKVDSGILIIEPIKVTTDQQEKNKKSNKQPQAYGYKQKHSCKLNPNPFSSNAVTN
eukprot:4919973-Ditylum_brightwellii.AAC.1